MKGSDVDGNYGDLGYEIMVVGIEEGGVELEVEVGGRG